MAEKAEEKKEEKKPTEPTKLELTEAELQARIEAAEAKLRKQFDKDRDDAKKKADEDAAKKQGEFKTLYESETARAKDLEAKLAAAEMDKKRLTVETRMRDYVAKNHAAYIGSVEWMARCLTVTSELTDEDADKQIKEIVEKFTKDNPRSTSATGTPPTPNRGKAPAGMTVPPGKNGQEKAIPRNRMLTASSW